MSVTMKRKEFGLDSIGRKLKKAPSAEYWKTKAKQFEKALTVSIQRETRAVLELRQLQAKFGRQDLIA